MNNKVTHNQEQENQTFWNKFPFLLAIFLIPFFVSSCELPSQAVIELTPTREEISTQPVTQTPTIEPTKKATPEIPPVGTLLPDSGIVISPENIDQIQEVAVIHKPIFSRALFTPDGNYVVLATGKFIFTYKTDKWYPEESTYDSGDSAINPIALSPDGQRIAFGTGEGKIKIVATFNGTLLNSISGSRKSITTVVFSPDGITFASGSEQGEVKIWKTLNGDLSSTLPLQGSSIQSIAYSPDGKFLAVGAGDGTFSIWNIAEKNLLIKVAAHKYSVSDLHYSPDGQTIISAAVDHTIGIWNATTGINKQYFKVDEGVVDTPYKIAVSPDGENVAAGLEDGSAKIWNIRTGELKKELTGEVQYWKTRFIRSVDYSPDGKFLIATSVEGVIKIWEIATGAMDISSYLITGVVNNLSFSPDGQFLASSDTGVINLWRVADGQLLHSMSGTDYYEIYGLAISPDNKTFLSTAYDEGLQYWNTGSGSFIGNVPTRVGTGEEFSCPVGILDGNNPYNEEVGKISTCSSGDQVVAGGSWGSVFFWSFEKGGIEEVWNDVSPDHYSIHQVVCT
ncbi:MAG: hypothetical protein VB013_07085, partial [Anaerolineaceae bacterium]|nr:hypothetical protein [Anaerolineaceae bacterium]